ncbi:MAG: serine/threonine protein kinase, partial [Myxococcales bacterium]|nr:serine/threonine protein kinase [Myxococcales bacterium]
MSTGGPDAAVVVDGRFELRRQLGEGGQAVVWSVFDRRLNVERAIKILLPKLAHSPKLRARFEDEARAMAVLEHTNVVRVYDVAECNGAAYFVMERVRGGSLADRVVRSGPLPPRLAVQTALQICAGAAAAHAVGIVHRDIKPHNVLV